jgi:uncharacterized protein with HEPN domain
MKTIREYLSDMLDYIERIERATAEGENVFMRETLIQDAVIRQYEVIGEIAKRLPDEVLGKMVGVNWTEIKGFRDFLAHNYDRVDLDIVWGAIQKLPDLRAAVENKLVTLPPNEDNNA